MRILLISAGECADADIVMEVADPAVSSSIPYHRTEAIPVRLGNVFIDRLPRESLAECLQRLSESGSSRRVVSCRTRDVIRARQDWAFRDLLLSTDLVIGSGSGIRFLGILARARLDPVAYPAHVAEITLATAASQGWKVFFLGGRRDEVFNFAHEASRRHSGLRIVGALEGLKNHDDEDAAQRLVQRVNESGADVILTSPSTRAGEEFAYRYRRALDSPLVVTVWGGFDAGFKERLLAPASTLPAYITLALQTIWG